jgi:hypothetical protein
VLSDVGHVLTDGTVWLVIGVAILALLGSVAFGIWVGRLLGLIDSDAPAVETIGVGLGVSLLITSALVATLGSGGNTVFAPVAGGFVVSLALAARGAARGGEGVAKETGRIGPDDRHWSSPPWSRLIGPTALSILFVIGVALLYAATIVPPPRDGLQPLPIMDTAFYSVLGGDLAHTGIESTLAPSGFDRIDGLPRMNWYHWGEMWLAAGPIKLLGVEPFAARHLIVLPILLVAAAMLTGTLVRAFAHTAAVGAFLTGFAASLLLAPTPLIEGSFFSAWASGLVFGINLYGMAVVALPLAIYFLLRSRTITFDPGRSLFVASTIAYLLPAHIVIAGLAAGAVAVVLGIRCLRIWLMGSSIPLVPGSLQGTAVGVLVLVGMTIAWAVVTGHGIPTSGVSPQVEPFNGTWQATVSGVLLGGGLLYAGALAWFLARRKISVQTDLYVATAAVVIVGAIVWGARLGEYNTFHVFFSAIATFGTIAGAVGVWELWRRLHVGRLAILAFIPATLFVLQLAVGALFSVVRLQVLGPHDYASVPSSFLRGVASLPEGAKLAYACGPTEEVAFWDPMLLAVGVYTGHRIVPMCFEADILGPVLGAPLSPSVENPLFRQAPQRVLYPTATSTPSSSMVRAFLLEHGIGYIYADRMHPNSLVPEASPVIRVDEFSLLQIPQ